MTGGGETAQAEKQSPEWEEVCRGRKGGESKKRPAENHGEHSATKRSCEIKLSNAFESLSGGDESDEVCQNDQLNVEKIPQVDGIFDLMKSEEGPNLPLNETEEKRLNSITGDKKAKDGSEEIEEKDCSETGKRIKKLGEEERLNANWIEKNTTDCELSGEKDGNLNERKEDCQGQNTDTECKEENQQNTEKDNEMEEKKLNSITGDKKSKDWSDEMEAEMESRLQQAEEQGGSFKHLRQKELLK